MSHHPSRDTMKAFEINFDGIVGLTHYYGGLSYGNIASMDNKKRLSNPQEAALQGIEKMQTLFQLGIKQAVLPPHERPHLPTLRSLGYEGTNKQILEKVKRECPEILYMCSSAAAMWTANAATMCPSIDSSDYRLHLTPANLTSKFHRSIEYPTTGKILKSIFSNPYYFQHHRPLPSNNLFSDEGAANHTRFCVDYASSGLHLYVYGREALRDNHHTNKFPTRQTLEASQAIARLHRLNDHQVVFAQQNPQAIDVGVFHNDVISVGNQNVYLYHELSFVNTPEVIDLIRNKSQSLGIDIVFIEVKDQQIPLKEAVASYLFNSQILTLQDGSMVLVAPLECAELPSVKAFIDQLLTLDNHPIKQVYFINLRQSMLNGGGPACLRMRIVVTQEELRKMNSAVIFNNELYSTLKNWVKKHYRDQLSIDDLADPLLLQETYEALEELTQILNLGAIYDFQ